MRKDCEIKEDTFVCVFEEGPNKEYIKNANPFAFNNGNPLPEKDSSVCCIKKWMRTLCDFKK